LVVATDSATAAICRRTLRHALLASDRYTALAGMVALLTAALLLLARVFPISYIRVAKLLNKTNFSCLQ